MMSNSNNAALYRETSETLPGLCSAPWSILVPICSPLHVLNDHSWAAPPPPSPTPAFSNALAPPLDGMIIWPSEWLLMHHPQGWSNPPFCQHPPYPPTPSSHTTKQGGQQLWPGGHLFRFCWNHISKVENGYCCLEVWNWNDVWLGVLETCLVQQRSSRYDVQTRPCLQAETHSGVFVLGRVFVCQPSNQSDPLQIDISPTNPPSQLCKYCTVTVRAAWLVRTDQVLLMHGWKWQPAFCLHVRTHTFFASETLTIVSQKAVKKKVMWRCKRTLHFFNSCSAHYTHLRSLGHCEIFSRNLLENKR